MDCPTPSATGPAGKNDYTAGGSLTRERATREPDFAGQVGARLLNYATCARAAASVLYISIVTVSGPTPRGTGVIDAAISFAAAKSTSPTTPDSVRLIPTSITTAPGLIISAVMNFGFPIAATRISACRQIAARSF